MKPDLTKIIQEIQSQVVGLHLDFSTLIARYGSQGPVRGEAARTISLAIQAFVINVVEVQNRVKQLFLKFFLEASALKALQARGARGESATSMQQPEPVITAEQQAQLSKLHEQAEHLKVAVNVFGEGLNEFHGGLEKQFELPPCEQWSNDMHRSVNRVALLAFAQPAPALTANKAAALEKQYKALLSPIKKPAPKPEIKLKPKAVPPSSTKTINKGLALRPEPKPKAKLQKVMTLLIASDLAFQVGRHHHAKGNTKKATHHFAHSIFFAAQHEKGKRLGDELDSVPSKLQFSIESIQGQATNVQTIMSQYNQSLNATFNKSVTNQMSFVYPAPGVISSRANFFGGAENTARDQPGSDQSLKITFKSPGAS